MATTSYSHDPMEEPEPTPKRFRDMVLGAVLWFGGGYFIGYFFMTEPGKRPARWVLDFGTHAKVGFAFGLLCAFLSIVFWLLRRRR